jgi:hypothetical protein
MTGFQSKQAAAQAKLNEDDDIQDYKRPWVGLTDEQVAQLAATHLFQNVWPHSTFAAISAIEAKLKELNT